MKAKGEGEQWKIFVVAKAAAEGLTLLCQNFEFSVGVVSSSSRVELGDFVKVAGQGLSV